MKIHASFGWAGPDAEDVVVTNRAAASIALGDLMMIDRRRSDPDSTSNSLGVQASGIANVITPVSTVPSDLAANIFGVTLMAAGDNGKTKIRLSGYVDAAAVAGDVVLASDDAYGPVTATRNITKLVTANTGAAAALPRKALFIPLTARTGAGLTDGWFDGIYGFGTVLV